MKWFYCKRFQKGQYYAYFDFHGYKLSLGATLEFNGFHDLELNIYLICFMLQFGRYADAR